LIRLAAVKRSFVLVTEMENAAKKAGVANAS
jgi:hypothetical protein